MNECKQLWIVCKYKLESISVPFDYLKVVDKKIRLEGFSVYDYEHEWKDALGQVVNWILEVNKIVFIRKKYTNNLK